MTAPEHGTIADRLAAILQLYRYATREELPIPALIVTTDGMPPVLRFRSERDVAVWADRPHELLDLVEPIHSAGLDLGRYVHVESEHGAPKAWLIEVRWPAPTDVPVEDPMPVLVDRDGDRWLYSGLRPVWCLEKGSITLPHEDIEGSYGPVREVAR